MDSPTFIPESEESGMDMLFLPESSSSNMLEQYSENAEVDLSNAGNEEGPRKRKRAELGPELTAHFQKLSDDYARLEPDAIVRHYPKSEPLPKLPAYHASFGKAEEMAKGVVHDIREAVLTDEGQDEESAHMTQCLDLLPAPDIPIPRMISIYGNCGVGKSSLSNATLGIEGASLKTSDGGSGTLVPIELAHTPKNSRYPFMGYVYYFPYAESERMINKSYANYYEARIATPNNLIEESSPIDLGKEPLEIFLALFGDRPQFRDEESAISFLKTPSALQDLHTWSKVIYDKLSRLGNVTIINRHTLADLNIALDPFTQSCESPYIEEASLNCSVYPFVQKVRKCLRSHTLARNMIYVDLPGVSDTSRQRLSSANHYFRQSQQVIIVHPIERAESDSSLQQYILDVFHRKRSGSVAVVLTRSDDIEYEPNSRIKYTPQQEKQLSSLADYQAELDAELMNFAKKSRNERNVDQLTEMLHKQGLYQFLQKHIKCLQTEILVAARNNKIRTNLQRWYQSTTRDSQKLTIFCTSSRCYMAHVNGFSISDPPLLSVSTTEIPDFRSFLFGLAGNGGKVEALKRYRIQIRSILDQMDLSCVGSQPMRQREHLMQIIALAKQDVSKQFRDVLEDLIGQYVFPILKKCDASGSAWLEHASDFCHGLRKYPYQGFHAFMKHEGKWKTPACGQHDWNNSLIAILREDVQPLVDHFLNDGCSSFQAEACQTMSELLDKVERDIRENLDLGHVDAFKLFFSSLRNRKDIMTDDIIQVATYLHDQIRKMNNDALNNGEEYPFTIKMKAIYADSFNIPTKQGQTKHAARWNRYHELVCDSKGNPYAFIKRYLERGFKKTFEKVENSAITKCENVVAAVMHDFKQVCPERKGKSGQKLRRRKELGKKVKEAKQKINGPLLELMDECGIPRD